MLILRFIEVQAVHARMEITVIQKKCRVPCVSVRSRFIRGCLHPGNAFAPRRNTQGQSKDGTVGRGLR